MERTKTKKRLRIPLPGALLELLEWHCHELPPGPMQSSELLFPSETGGFRAASCLDRPIRRIAEAAGIGKRLTAKFMRRTFQDLARAANVHDFVTRTISGHATLDMQRHYSTVSGDEVRSGLARVISLAGFREAAVKGGDRSGDGGRHLMVPVSSALEDGK